MKFFSKIKNSKIFWGIVFFLFIAGLVVFLDLGLKYYDQWKGEKRVKELAQEMDRIEREIYNKKAADTYGGKTPQETLEMFIEAVEKGDYELASKYFVIEKQEEAKHELYALHEKNNIKWFLSILRNASGDENRIKDGHFRMRSKLDIGPPDYFIDFTLYPSGNWKIEDI